MCVENKRLDCKSWMGWCHVNYLRICLGMFGVDQWWVLKKRKKKVFSVSETDPST